MNINYKSFIFPLEWFTAKLFQSASCYRIPELGLSDELLNVIANCTVFSLGLELFVEI